MGWITWKPTTQKKRYPRQNRSPYHFLWLHKSLVLLRWEKEKMFGTKIIFGAATKFDFFKEKKTEKNTFS